MMPQFTHLYIGPVIVELPTWNGMREISIFFLMSVTRGF